MYQATVYLDDEKKGREDVQWRVPVFTLRPGCLQRLLRMPEL